MNIKNPLYGLIAAIGVSFIGIGEWLILFNPQGNYGFDNYDFLAGKSALNITIGHFLVTLLAPAYFLGYFFIASQIKKSNQLLKNIYTILSIYMFSLAMIWVSARSYLAFSIMEKFSAPENSQIFLEHITQNISSLSDPLLYIVWILLLITSSILIYLILTQQTNFPKYSPIFSPIFLLASIFLIYFTIPRIGTYILPTAMNITHVIFFGVGAYVIWKNPQKNL